jgi:hypothetical protein
METSQSSEQSMMEMMTMIVVTGASRAKPHGGTSSNGWPHRPGSVNQGRVDIFSPAR